MDIHPEGFVHTDDNGITRSFDGSGNVIDFVRLGPEALQELLDGHVDDPGQKKRLTDLWANLDNSQISEDEIRNPSAEQLQSIFADMGNEKMMTSLAPRNDLIRTRCRPLCVRSAQCVKQLNCYVCTGGGWGGFGKCV
ncbi:hypothetical protein AJ78_05603 [Emergomyces pasteurianus Ep9510]|uniref:Uncharacterized protein n=1 Tax=Emergomyces pasteurianus Ep9510 TaxID=1447872 RepID=A0A1J9QFQ2_9EURO|nr:hypothetical protein AJ78_05603 [Emergomyces pasteurianus Ep9510]